MKNARQVINDFVIKFLEGIEHYKKNGFYKEAYYDLCFEDVIQRLRDPNNKSTLSWVLSEFLNDDFHKIGIVLEDKWGDGCCWSVNTRCGLPDCNEFHKTVYKIGKKIIMTKFNPIYSSCEYHFVKPKKRKVVVIDYEIVE